jgi:hypothetical protein
MNADTPVGFESAYRPMDQTRAIGWLPGVRPHPESATEKAINTPKSLQPIETDSIFVMAGLVPAIHVFLACGDKYVDARHKAGHDDGLAQRTQILWSPFPVRL